ncbi:MAG: hypothetical protein GY806_18335 [Gammaproteobacteria bacterium]|nr:hypothetical protein [Gammaproteobacteria bacterium]
MTQSSLSTEVQLSRVQESALDIDLLNLNNLELEQQIETLLSSNQFKQANTRLLEIAADAVEAGDDRQLGNVLLLLGSAAIDNQELNSAELLLQEALEIARRQNDKLTMAKTYQQLGRLNIKARALARYAAESYDRLWLARSQIFLGEYRKAEENLNVVIAANTEIRRYGAAAGALETMAQFHQKFHNDYQAQLANAEAARLYATSGQLNRARTIIGNLKSSGYDPSELDFLGRDVESLFRQYEQDLVHVSQAQDLKMLYHHYRSEGEHRRAWQLRIKASRLLGKTSETAVFERGADVLAILYNSNFAMDRARQYLSQADSLFSGFGAEDNAVQAQTMQSLIY